MPNGRKKTVIDLSVLRINFGKYSLIGQWVVSQLCVFSKPCQSNFPQSVYVTLQFSIARQLIALWTLNLVQTLKHCLMFVCSFKTAQHSIDTLKMQEGAAEWGPTWLAGKVNLHFVFAPATHPSDKTRERPNSIRGPGVPLFGMEEKSVCVCVCVCSLFS